MGGLVEELPGSCATVSVTHQDAEYRRRGPFGPGIVGGRK